MMGPPDLNSLVSEEVMSKGEKSVRMRSK